MAEQIDDQLDEIDFAVAAYRVGGEWRVEEITDNFLTDAEALADGLRRIPGDRGAIGLVGVAEDFFLLLRVTPKKLRLVLSDATAVHHWDLARSAADLIGPLSMDDDDPWPAGDLELFADLGLTGEELEDLIDDEDAYPDELVSEIADALGFGELFDEAVLLDEDEDDGADEEE